MAKKQYTSILDRVLDGDSSLSTNGEQPMINTNAGENTIERFFNGSVLDMDGETPAKYSDKAPEGQSGRI